MSAFASQRFTKIKQGFIASLYILSVCIAVILNIILFQYNTTIKVALVLVCGFLYGRILYKNISTPYLLLFVILEYLLTYLLSFISLYISALVCNLSIQEFRQKEITPFVISSAIYYFLQVVFILIIRKIIRDRKSLKNNLRQNSIQILLYLLFPLASFAMLLVLLRITSRQGLEEGAIIGCCWMIFIANVAILYLLEQMEHERQNREKLLALDQQLQLQAKNMEETCDLYSNQQKQVHDFRAHLEMLKQLLDDQQFTIAKDYLESILERQSERIFLVNCHHTILNALFNSKASKAVKLNIDIHFEVGDLAGLLIDSIDLTVLLSNLIDNAIEGCKKCTQKPSIQIQACIKNDRFIFIIRNTSSPVHIVQNEIESTKSDPHLHGFGLPNIKAILNKYHGEYAMSYKDRYFQFIFEIPLNLH